MVADALAVAFPEVAVGQRPDEAVPEAEVAYPAGVVQEELLGKMEGYAKEEEDEDEEKENMLEEVRKQHVQDYLDYLKSRKGNGEKVRMPRLPVKADKAIRESIVAPRQSLEWGEEEDKLKGI